MRNHGLDFKQRREILREKILLMKEIWTKVEASFSGEHIQFEKSWSWPKPVQKPHPPIILGAAAGPKTFPHIIEFCDGWMPVGGLHDFEGGLKGLDSACKDAGRDLDSLELGVFYAGGVDADQLQDSARRRGKARGPAPSIQVGGVRRTSRPHLALRGTSRPLHIRAYM